MTTTYRMLLLATFALALGSCAKSYSVKGSSSLSALDGSKLYLKAVKNGEMQTIDSCDVVHGEFHFAGLLDTVCMASLYMDDESIMPLVLEEGNIVIKIGDATQDVSGTPANDSLYQFIEHHRQLTNRMTELTHKQSQMLLEGIDEDVIDRQLSREAGEIAAAEDRLVTGFIVRNFDNILGPGIFMMITSQYRYPLLTPQIEDIMSKATAKFKADAYVSDYYRAAQENEARLNGTHDDVAAAPGAPGAPGVPAPAPPAAPLTNVPVK